MKQKSRCSIALYLISLLLTASLFGNAPRVRATTEVAPTWSIYSIDAVDPGYYVHYSYTSIAFDQQDRLHISYRGPAHDLRYATNQNNCWATAIVYDAAVAVARENSIAVDASNHPHISFSYRDGNDEDLMYAKNITGQWQVVSVDNGASVGMENDIAIDRNNQVHMSHWAWNGGDLKYATNINGPWTSTILTDATWVKTAVALDSSNNVHTVFVQNNLTKYATNQSGTWRMEIVDPVGPLVYPGKFAPDITVDGNNTPHVIYSTGNSLMYAKRVGGVWQRTVITTMVGSTPAFRAATAIAVDRNHHVHSSFYDPLQGDLKYVNNVAGTWQISTLDSAGDVGRSNSIAVDNNNYVHISYRDDISDSTAKLKYITNAPSPVLSSCGSDTIFADDFETDNVSAWSLSTGGGCLNVMPTAALVGNYGLQVTITSTTPCFVTDDQPNAEPHYRARFYFDPNSISMASGNAHYIFYGYSGISKVVLRIEFRFSRGKYQLRTALLNDGTTWKNSAWFTISDTSHSVELEWQAASAAGANNGSLVLWIDGVQKANLTAIDNDTRRIDRIHLGAVAGIDSGTHGAYFFDAFESRRQTYIGPANGAAASALATESSASANIIEPAQYAAVSGSLQSGVESTLAGEINGLHVNLVFPANAVVAPASVVVTALEDTLLPDGYTVLGSLLELKAVEASGAVVTMFGQPVTVTIHYSNLIDNAGQPVDVSLQRWNAATETWESMPFIVNNADQSIIAMLEQSATLAVMQQEKEEGPAGYAIYLPVVQK